MHMLPLVVVNVFFFPPLFVVYSIVTFFSLLILTTLPLVHNFFLSRTFLRPQITIASFSNLPKLRKSSQTLFHFGCSPSHLTNIQQIYEIEISFKLKTVYNSIIKCNNKACMPFDEILFCLYWMQCYISIVTPSAKSPSFWKCKNWKLKKQLNWIIYVEYVLILIAKILLQATVLDFLLSGRIYISDPTSHNASLHQNKMKNLISLHKKNENFWCSRIVFW